MYFRNRADQGLVHVGAGLPDLTGGRVTATFPPAL